MCGIFGYVGKNDNGIEFVCNGLERLLHRGCDSIGLCAWYGDSAEVYKVSTEKHQEIFPDNLPIPDIKRKCNLAFGHTRWATCGKVTDLNAHPHRSGKFIVVQNGNVENFRLLKKELLEKGFDFVSETDTEVIAHLFALHHNGDVVETAKKVLSCIVGANALVVLCTDQPDRLIAVNRGGTLILSKNENGVVVSSDPLPLKFFSGERIDLESNQVAVMKEGSVEILSASAKKVFCKPKELREKFSQFDTIMRTEIQEQLLTVRSTISGRIDEENGISKLGGISTISRDLRKAKTFHFVGCGTAYYACQYAVSVLNRFGIAAHSWIASEFSYAHPFIEPSDVFVFISQSGETADSIAVLNEIKIKGNVALGIVNVAGSKISRMTDAGIYIRAGLEVAVASTKAFTSQLVTIMLLALFLARQRKMTLDTGLKVIGELGEISDKIGFILQKDGKLKELARKYSGFKNYYFLGRYFNFIAAQEGALKLKEISYVHAEAYPLGEMKHGPLALIDPDFCCVVIVPKDTVYEKSLVNISEIKARGGKVIAVTNEQCIPDLDGLADDLIIVPEVLDYLSPVLTVIPLQLFAHDMAIEFGKNPDKPRNLAKTVTVE